MDNYKRGEIRFIDIPYSFGHEMAKNRPGIILTPPTEAMCCATVVYLTSVKSKNLMPTHVTIHSTGTLSYAKCEHIYTVDVSRVKGLVGKCSDVELKRVESAVRYHLGLSRFGEYQETVNRMDSEAAYEACMEEAKALKHELDSLRRDNERYQAENLKLSTQKDMYKELYQQAIREALSASQTVSEKPKAATFGSRLREARKDAGLRQLKLEDMTGIPAKIISKYETTDRQPMMEHAVKLARALNVKLEWLCCASDEK